MTNEVRICITTQSSRRATTRGVYWHYAGWLGVITRALSAVLGACQRTELLYEEGLFLEAAC